jgi:hypothetical protein
MGTVRRLRRWDEARGTLRDEPGIVRLRTLCSRCGLAKDTELCPGCRKYFCIDCTPHPPCSSCADAESVGDCIVCDSPLCANCADDHLETHDTDRGIQLDLSDPRHQRRSGSGSWRSNRRALTRWRNQQC